MKILLVEDNEQLNKALSVILSRNSFIVDSAFDGEEALTLIDGYTYDVIILDIMILKVNGLEVLKRAWEKRIETPILMLTAKSTTDDKVLGLNMGADDYLSKPFNIDELLARIKALSGKKSSYNNNSIIEYGDLKFDTDNSILYSNNNHIVLMNKESQIMQLLIKNKNNIVSLDRITETAWNIDDVDEKLLFERFYRSSSTKKEGSGIGLLNAKEIINLHKGNVKVIKENNILKFIISF